MEEQICEPKSEGKGVGALLRANSNLHEATEHASDKDLSKTNEGSLNSTLVQKHWDDFLKDTNVQADDTQDTLDDVLDTPVPDDSVLMNMFTKDVSNRNNSKDSQFASVFMSSDEYYSSDAKKQLVKDGFFSDLKSLLKSHNADMYVVSARDVKTGIPLGKRLEVRIGDVIFFMDEIPFNVDDININGRTKLINLKSENFDYETEVRNGTGTINYC